MNEGRHRSHLIQIHRNCNCSFLLIMTQWDFNAGDLSSTWLTEEERSRAGRGDNQSWLRWEPSCHRRSARQTITFWHANFVGRQPDWHDISCMEHKQQKLIGDLYIRASVRRTENVSRVERWRREARVARNAPNNLTTSTRSNRSEHLGNKPKWHNKKQRPFTATLVNTITNSN